MSSFNWPKKGGGTGSVYWQDAVATAASLPATGTLGEVRQALDTEKLYRWDGSAWQVYIDALGDVTGPASAVDGEAAVFNGTTGKIIKRATGSGPARLTSGVLGTGSTSLTSEVSGVLPVANGGTNSSTALNNNRVMQSSGGKVVEAAAITANKALASDANGIPVASSVTDTELGYVSGVTSSIQTQINAKVAKAGDTMTGVLTLSADPANPLEAATKQYVDSVAAGLDVKPSCRVATTANITLSGTQTIDGIAVIAGDRVLVKNQTSQQDNGIYVVAAGSWTRATDMDSWAEVPGAFAFIEVGTSYADTAWVCTADQGGTLGTTAITWSQFAGAGTYTADGNGINLTGTQFSLTLNGTTLSKSASGLKVNAGGITDTEVSSSAGITRSKLASGTANRLLYNVAVTGVMGDLAAITGNKALASDSNGLPVATSTTDTELGFVHGVTSAIQTQLDGKLCASSVVAVSSNVTLTDHAIHFVDTTSARSLTLPSPTSSRFIVVKDSTGNCATNNITIVRSASEKIETVAASYTLDTDLGSWTFVSNGTDWFII